jgi:CBS domain containing-hemolysin-like protein
MATYGLIILATLLCSAFFAGMEIAFLTSNKLRIELENKQEFLPAKILSYFVKHPSKFIATTLVGNNISLVIYGIFMARILEPYIELYVHSHAAILTIQTIISTLFIVMTAEFLPKALFRINANGTLNFFAVPFIIVYYLIYPIVFITIGLSEFLLEKVLRVNLDHDKVAFGRVDLDNYVRQFTSSDNKKIDHEIQIFQNALDFSAVKVRECMVPRTEIVAMDVNESIENLSKKFIDTHLSKILIYQESIDNIIGYVHSSELFKNPKSIRSILLPVAIVPETLPAKDMLQQLIKERKSIALVVDEFGGTSGMITIEDVMEEIFGEIEDEHDKEEMTEKKISDTEFIFSGRLEIDYLNETYKLNLPESEEYGTLAGLIINIHESIPSANEEISFERFKVKILAVSGNRIEQVLLKVKAEGAIG